MGQYYRAVSINRKQAVSPYDYDNGAKLMEHSFLTNSYLNVVMMLLSAGGAWHKTRLVWAGDYSEQKQDELIPAKVKAAYSKWYDKTEPEYALKYPENRIPNLYNLVTKMGKNGKIPSFGFQVIRPAEPTQEDVKLLRFIVNHTKKEFVDLTKCPKDKKNFGWELHPLSLLTCDSFGSGGSYHGENKYRGTWVGDVISAEPFMPAIDFKEIKPNFKE
jgi:hypothetical protein